MKNGADVMKKTVLLILLLLTVATVAALIWGSVVYFQKSV